MAGKVGEEFVKVYYALFDGQGRTTEPFKSNLRNMYHPNAKLSFEGAQHIGPDSIMQKFEGLPLTAPQRVLTTVDAQPASDGTVTLMVVGQIKDAENKPMMFAEHFILCQVENSMYITNHIFRLMLHNF